MYKYKIMIEVFFAQAKFDYMFARGFSREDTDIKWPGAYRFRAVRDYRLGPRQEEEEEKTSAMHALAPRSRPLKWLMHSANVERAKHERGTASSSRFYLHVHRADFLPFIFLGISAELPRECLSRRREGFSYVSTIWFQDVLTWR